MTNRVGYLNAHCHLELSALAGRIPPGLPFAEWLERLVRIKRDIDPVDLLTAARSAYDRMRATGTMAVADIVSLDLSPQIFLRAGSGRRRFLNFREIIGFQVEAAEAAVQEAIERQRSTEKQITAGEGLSPHAPYTTTAPLLRAAAREASRLGQWLCIHAAEDPSEREMLLRGKGSLRDFLAPHLDPGWAPPGMGPIQWLDDCGCLGPRTLLVHCNDVDEEDIRLIARRGCSVVVCPGTHLYFGRGPFPLARLLEAGIPVYLGTDSLASNTDLDMAREVELAAELAPGVDQEVIGALALASRAEGFLSP